MNVTLEGNPVELRGGFPKKGDKVQGFTLVDGSLAERGLDEFKGQFVVLNIFPSIDTDVCATSVREFESRALGIENLKILGISKDLPFAQKRFCLSQNIERAITLSGFRNVKFGQDYGVEIAAGPLRGLYSRAVVILNPQGEVIYSELVPEITQEPNYENALAALNS